MSSARLVPAVALLALLLPGTALSGAAGAAGDGPVSTRCEFDGPVPSHRALRVDLPEGSDFLTLELRGTRNAQAAGDEASWHLAEGIAVIDAATRRLVAHQVLNSGTAPPVVVAERDGTTVVRQGVVGPDGPWVHGARQAVTGLAPGSYWVVAFGAGGPATGARAQRWGASVHVEGVHTCTTPVAGEVFDHDHTDFRGGTQVHVPGAGYAEDVTLEMATERPLVFGFVDAATQGQETGEVAVGYATPSATGTLSRGITPFVSTAGPHRWTASYRGAYPVVSVTGIALALPTSSAPAPGPSGDTR